MRPIILVIMEGRAPSVPEFLRRHRGRPSKSRALNSREQRHRFAHDMSVRQSPPLRIGERKSLFSPAQLHFHIQLIENSMRSFRHYWRNKKRDDAERLSYVIKHTSKKCFRFRAALF